MPHALALGLLLLCAPYVYYMHWHLFRQPTNPTSQSTNHSLVRPFVRPSVHPSIRLSGYLSRPCLVAAVSALFCSSSSLSLTVSSGYNGKQGCQAPTGVTRKRESERGEERESTCPGCDCIAFDLFGPARFMRIRHGKLPETAKLVTDFNV